MPAAIDPVAVLVQTYLFGELSPAELEPLARTARLLPLRRGEYAFRVGDPADALHIVAAGQLRDAIVTEDGEEVMQNLFGPGQVFGDPGFFASERRIMDALATEPSLVIALARQHLMPFLHAHPQVLLRALESMSAVARSQTMVVAALARGSLRARLLMRLLELADSIPRRDDGAAVTPRISQAALAAMVGVSRENVNRALAGMIADGSVRLEDGRYVLPDRDALWQEASSGWPEIAKRNRRSL